MVNYIKEIWVLVGYKLIILNMVVGILVND